MPHNNLVIPEFLKPGSKVAIVAPAGRVFAHELDFALHWLREKEWIPVLDESCFVQYDFGYKYAGDVLHRLQRLQTVLDSEEIDAIWCARGGYGCIHLVDNLEVARFLDKPKWLIGYSDITVLHNWLNNLGVASLHAVTAKRILPEQGEVVYDSMHSMLSGKLQDKHWAYHTKNQLGSARGRLVGGNLSLLYSQLGSKTALQQDNIILFLEDWKENWYHLDRMMMALKRSGLFSRLQAVIVGSFTQMDVPEENPAYSYNFDEVAEQILSLHLESLDIPVAFGCKAGHIVENYAMMMGVEVELSVSKSSSILKYL
ncbi:MAG: LD-carboxypeptidase [Weeksellaceae bacterium]|nr:LD-carboxypeptidase [Weeksellaceae bacterium]